MTSEATGVFLSLGHRKKRLQLGEESSLLPVLPKASSGRQLRERAAAFIGSPRASPLGVRCKEWQV